MANGEKKEKTRGRWMTWLNKEDDNLLLQYGNALYSQGIIASPSRYHITKFLLMQAVNLMKNQLKQNSNGQVDEGGVNATK